MRQLNSSAVNVSWSRFDSEDVFYRVYYWSPPGQAEFSGNSSWGVIARLQGQTQFEVAAVVIIQGVPTEGLRSETVCSGGGNICLPTEGPRPDIINITTGRQLFLLLYNS